MVPRKFARSRFFFSQPQESSSGGWKELKPSAAQPMKPAGWPFCMALGSWGAGASNCHESFAFPQSFFSRKNRFPARKRFRFAVFPWAVDGT